MDAARFEITPSVSAALQTGVPPVQAFREWRGYGVTALAVASGVPAGTIAEHEAGRMRLSSEECEAIGAALDVPAELLQD